MNQLGSGIVRNGNVSMQGDAKDPYIPLKTKPSHPVFITLTRHHRSFDAPLFRDRRLQELSAIAGTPAQTPALAILP